MSTKAARRRAETHLIYYTLLMPQMMWVVVPVHAVPGPSRCKIRGQDKRKHFAEHEIPINLKEESKNRPLEASTCVSPSNPCSTRHVTSKNQN